jgi:hypothetical protein
MVKLINAFAAAFIICASSAHAQSFFLNLGTDPSTGVDRGSASVVRKVDTRTGFLTVSSIGAEEIRSVHCFGDFGMAGPDAGGRST